MSISEQKFRDLLDRYLNGKATEKEVQLLDSFFDSYRIDDQVSSLQIDPRIKEEIHQRILEKVESGKKQRSFIWWKVAACFAIVIAATAVYYTAFQHKDKAEQRVTSLHTESTRRGEKMSVELPDGSTVHLNSNSSLSYAGSFNENTREVSLRGEAYFEVMHDTSRPFIVKTGDVKTQVLGTSFNVLSTEKDPIQVTLVKGKVGVTIANQSVTLEPNEQAQFHPITNTLSKAVVDVNEFIAWRNNVLDFRSITLEQAVSKLEDWYDVDITIDSPTLARCVITAQYKDESLENVLKSIQFLLNAKITTVSERQVRISGKGCN